MSASFSCPRRFNNDTTPRYDPEAAKLAVR
jgi:hypothetical protein